MDFIEEMKVVAIDNRRSCQLITKPLPRVGSGYNVIKVHVAPMCNEYHAYANLDFRDRNRPDSLGHEAAGEVVAVYDSTRFRIGDRVVALDGYPCGACDTCFMGCYAHCPNLEDPLVRCNSLSGDCGFAQYLLKADWMLVPIPQEISYEHASMAVCGLGATYTAMENMGIGADNTVLITGLGPVGLGGVINGVLRGARVIGIARNTYRAALARELGAFTVIDPQSQRALHDIYDLTGGRGVDYAIDCSATPTYQRLALAAVRRLGRVAFLGESGNLTVNVYQDLIQKGVTLSGSLDLFLPHVQGMMSLIARAGELIDKFITHRLPLTLIKDAFELQLSGNCGKIILYPWQES